MDFTVIMNFSTFSVVPSMVNVKLKIWCCYETVCYVEV
jgi:hypothetical protein